jgi:allophanate hydrolase
VTETIASLLAGHRSGERALADTVRRVFCRIRETGDPAIFISLRDEASVLADAEKLAGTDRSLPLYGIPVAIKDNIDVANLPTTAACPAFAYAPRVHAEAAARLERAGAIIVGKTNLDQFATGLVGVRSPYGVPRNPLRGDLIPGGSSSGSAVAVARGIVPLALGTDTAGSGRVPACFNNIVGLKPSLGLVSTVGVVPACRSLDCVSIFALTVDDAFAALQAIAGIDARDPFSRAMALGALSSNPPGLRIGVPRETDRLAFSDRNAEAGFAAAMALAGSLGARLVDVDMQPLFATAKLLYDGPWVAERTAALADFIARRPDDVHPVTRAIISQGAAKSAAEVFNGILKLAEFRLVARKLFVDIDVLMVPTIPFACTIAEVEADPIGPNTRLGTYTNFVNLLDLAGLAAPATLATDGTPFGVTLLAPAGRDAQLASLGRALHARAGLTLGALGIPQPPLEPVSAGALPGEAVIAVVGAHLSGMPLNHELASLGARFLEATSTAPDYQLFALQGVGPARPGLLRVAAGTGAPITLETWALSIEAFGRFASSVPAPLSIGSVRLGDGRLVKGFLVEAEAVKGARNISSFGGWRAFVAHPPR